MKRVWKIVLIVALCFLGSNVFAQRPVTRRWTYEEFNNVARKLPWSPDSTKVLFFGAFREITTTTLDSVHVNNVRFVKEHFSRTEARRDFYRLLDFYRMWELEDWEIDRYTWVIYFKNYGVYLHREENTVEIEYLPFFGD